MNEVEGHANARGRESSSDAHPVPGYPADLVSQIVTRLGTVLQVRPIRPDDAPLLVDFHRRLSLRSVYRRFLYVHRSLSAAEVERFTRVDYVNRLALVAEDDNGLVAVARYDRTPGTAEAEVAFVVADHYQHHGVGTLLLEELAAAAWERGVTTFVATTLVENREMLRVFADSGFQVTTELQDGIVSVRFPIAPDEAYRAALKARHHHGQSTRSDSDGTR